jgi:hypothetical protein
MDCPMCKKGKLELKTETNLEIDTPMSIIMGTAMGTGFFPMQTAKSYSKYECNRCGYNYKI